MNIFHITHTNIKSDNRILKEMSALAEVSLFRVHGAGVVLEEQAAETEQRHAFSARSIDLFSRKLRWLPRPLRYTVMMSELTLRFLWQGIALKPKVVHCHDTLVLPAGVLIKLLTGAKLVYDAHELESNKNGQTRFLSQGTLFIEKLCWRWVDLLVSVSDSILSWYGTNLGAKKNVLILNSPEIEIQDGSTRDEGKDGKYFHRRYAIPDEKLIFVYLGIFGAGRGIESTLEAFSSETTAAHLVLVGYGELLPMIDSYCNRYPNIHLHKPVPHEQVVNLVKNADVGVCLIENVSLSDYYCLPNKLFEYGFARLYVLASDFPDISRVVRKYSLGTTCGLTVEEIREAVNDIVNEPPGRINTDLSGLTWQQQAERLVKCYQEILALDDDKGSRLDAS